MGELIFIVICFWALTLSGGMVLAKLTWTPPGQGWRRNETGKRLVDVLDDHTVLGKNMAVIYDKFVILYQRMEDTNPNIDDPELRWVEHKIEQMEDGYTPTKNDLLTANLYWNKWETK